MKFGRTLQDRISEEWAPHSVDYKGMKRALKDDVLFQDFNGSADPKSDGGGSSAPSSPHSYSVDQDEFFRLLEGSKDRIKRFYLEREVWATGRVLELRHQVDALRGSPPSSWSSSVPISLGKLVGDLRHEIETLMEFLTLNLTGFSKILKKYDKRTGSTIREEEMLALRRAHPYLEGAALADLKEKLAVMEAELEQLRRVKEEGMSDAGRKRTRPRKKTRDEVHFEKCQVYLRKTLENSAFFTNNSARIIPHFQQEEIRSKQLLGYGEFNNVYEIEEFEVPESCHICFLHKVGGCSYQEAGESSGSTDTRHAGTRLEHEEMQHSDSQQASIGGTTISEVKEEVKDEKTIATQPTPVQSGRSISLEIEKVSEYDEEDSDHEEEEHETRGFMKDHCHREGKARYAIKKLRDDLPLDAKEDAALDLAIEARFLAVLVHPNIIKIRGTVGLAGSLKFSIVLDRLNCTLAEKSSEWFKLEKKLRGFMGVKKRKNKERLQGLWMDRILALYDVSRAMRYLHQHNIVFRDLKPDNIGFDIRGDAKVFDFGLAVELKSKDQVGKDKYKLSGLTGTRRYMAPEVVLCKPYGLNADVFSFGITAWETASLQVPFEDYSPEKHADQVVLKGQRPKIPSSWPPVFKNMIKECWSSSPSERPSFSQVCSLVRGDLSDRERGLTLTDRSNQLMDASLTSRTGF